METGIFLFDLDGVLVKPGGYREAVRATVNTVARSMGLPPAAPDDDALAIFEAQGITGEWDMIPLSLAILLDVALDGVPIPPEGLSLRNIRSVLPRSPEDGLQVDYGATIRQLGAYIRPGQAPADSFLALNLAGEGRELFPRLAGTQILGELLTGTRQLELSHTTRLFENYVLGDQNYQTQLGLQPDLQSESFLAQFDRPLLAPETRSRLCALRDAGVLAMAAYTARPSAWHAQWPDHGRLPAMFAPEAEIALRLTGMESIPLVGYGQMGGLALRLGRDEDAFIKPAPYHALGAVAAACCGDRQAALGWLENTIDHLEGRGDHPGFAIGSGRLPATLRIHVFEDSPIGMRGASQAAALFGQLGLPVKLHLWGIAGHAEKAAALRKEGAEVLADVNVAVERALSAA